MSDDTYTLADCLNAGACIGGVAWWIVENGGRISVPISALRGLSDENRRYIGLDGYGNSDGHGDGDGNGHGNGNGHGDGCGYGSSYGNGDGDGDGYGDGNGYGDGDSYGLCGGDGNGFGGENYYFGEEDSCDL